MHTCVRASVESRELFTADWSISLLGSEAELAESGCERTSTRGRSGRLALLSVWKGKVLHVNTEPKPPGC